MAEDAIKKLENDDVIVLDKEENEFLDAAFKEWLSKNGITPDNTIDEID